MPVTTTHAQLALHDVTRRFGDRVVLDGVDLVVGAGERLGLVGENGSGKSTLLRLAAGLDTPDGGTIVAHGAVGLLPQRVELPGSSTVGDLLSSAVEELDALHSELRRLEAEMSRPDVEDLDRVLERYGELAEELELRDGWTAASRLDAAVAGVGVAHIDRDRTLATLSGGQRSRLALAALLVRRPAVLLLDEPTTHLDDDAVAFLERQVVDWPGAVLLASHDRAFLDVVCTAVVDLDASRGDGLVRYGGAYTGYVAAKAQERARWDQAYRDWQDEHNRLTALSKPQNVRVGHLDRGPRDNDKSLYSAFKASTELAVARRVKDAQQRLSRLERVPKPPAPLRFSGRLWIRPVRDGVVLAARDVVVPGRVAVRALDIAHDTRLLVTGPNGSGKSSLLAVLAGQLKPASGRVTRARGVRVGLLPQETHWDHPERNVLSAFAHGRHGDVDEQVKALLDVGVLHPQELRTPIGRLSVGQQRRVALARLVADDPDLLLMDEPTDHLSLALVEELEDALRVRSGPLVVVSHDRWLRRRWDGEVRDVRELA